MSVLNMRVSHKLWATIVALLVLVLGVGAAAVQGQCLMGSTVGTVQRYEANISAALRWQGAILKSLETATAAIATSEPHVEDLFNLRLNDGRTMIADARKAVEQGLQTEADREGLAAVVRRPTRWLRSCSSWTACGSRSPSRPAPTLPARNTCRPPKNTRPA
jgi:hypothetical protein